jgi:short-subunit dehydrogenase
MSRGTALITGASSGIGEAFARLLASEDFDLILTARRKDRLGTLKDELSAEVTVTIIAADLSKDSGVNALIEAIAEQHLTVDLLINNAGMLIHEDFTALTDEQISQTLSLNINAATRLIHTLLPAMLKRRTGRILNVASVAAFHPVPGMDLYAATKAYVLSLTESLAENLRGTGVSMTALCPGLTDTDQMDRNIANSLPPFMIATPEDVAREGFEALMNKEVIRVPGNANKLAVSVAQHQPRWLVRGLGGLAAKLTSNR